ncbi:MAG: hypothetical protein Pg6C_08830 [Treponemataceae bacterium]|nr:MAG: hypothetical protein Pg6C_08830 [Treponemataceae bacterium]
MVRNTLRITMAALLLAAVMYSCASAPNEAEQQVLADSREKMEAARKQAQEFGGPEYAADEWNAAESIYNTVRDVQPAKKKEYEAALATMQDAASGYDGAFQKAIPQYAQARKDIIVAARGKAAGAGAGALAPDLLAGADQKDKNSLAQFDRQDYYGYQKDSQEAEALYEITAIQAEALSAKQEIDSNKLARFDTGTYEEANRSLSAVKTAYDGQDADGMKTAAEDALAKYRQVLDKGWHDYAGEKKSLADDARSKAVAARADTVLKNDFANADTVYKQGNDELAADSYKPAAASFDRSQQLYASLAANAEKQQKDAAAALQTAQKKVSDSQAKAKAVPGADNNPSLKKALENIASAQKNIAAADYKSAAADAAEAQKNAGLSDDFTAQMQKANAAKEALAAAKTQMDGVPNDARAKYAAQYKTASDAYADGVKAQTAQDWNTVTADAKKITDAVAALNKAKAADDEADKKAGEAALAAAKTRLDGVSADNQKTYAAQYKTASDAYADGVKAQTAKNWATVNADAKKIHDALDQMDKAIAEAEAEALQDAVVADAQDDSAVQQQIQEAHDAIAAAKERLDWAQGVNAPVNFPENYALADEAYANGETALSEQNWDGVITAANTVIEALADVTERAPLPSQYTVRTWTNQRDCLWNIAGYPWVYNDPWQWRRLYEANRDKLPNASNADEIEIGTVLDIPSMGDEVRQGMWDEAKEYQALPST